MKIAGLEVPWESNATSCHLGRIALVGLVAAASLFLVTGRASAAESADAPLSTTILSIPEPGFVAVPLGDGNGPITQSNVGQILSDDPTASEFGKSLADGDITAYLRSWSHQPNNGDAIIIFGYQFTYAGDEGAFMGGLNGQLRRESGGALFDVADIPGAVGAEAHTTTASNVPITEYVVSFTKGNEAFQVVVATTSGDLTNTDAASVAHEQFASAPDVPAKGGHRTVWHRIGGAPLIGLGVIIVILLLSRLRKYPVALRGQLPLRGQNHNPPPASPSGSLWSPSPTTEETSTGDRPKVGAEQWQ
jgi:hypothetical protein